MVFGMSLGETAAPETVQDKGGDSDTEVIGIQQTKAARAVPLAARVRAKRCLRRRLTH